MTEIDTNMPARIWARLSPNWHDDVTGEEFVGGMFDAGHFCDGTPYVPENLYTAVVAERDKLRKQVNAAKATLLAFSEPDNWFDVKDGSSYVPAWRGPNPDYPEEFAQMAFIGEDKSDSVDSEYLHFVLSHPEAVARQMMKYQNERDDALRRLKELEMK